LNYHKWAGVLVGLSALAGLLVAWGIVFARAADEAQLTPVPAENAGTTEEPRREISGEPESPAISFIDSPTATCYRPVASTGACYISWNYLYVTASSGQYIISMTVTIDGRLRAYHSGFFQSYMYVPWEMYNRGYKITCGLPGASGITGLGNTYSYVIRARETGGLSAANYGSVACPADVVNVFSPLIMKR
jgi:hypothetical protein